jgi:hypothetical protein
VGSTTETPFQHLKVSAYTVPTDMPESDGTLAWDSTTLVLVEVTAGNVCRRIVGRRCTRIPAVP